MKNLAQVRGEQLNAQTNVSIHAFNVEEALKNLHAAQEKLDAAKRELTRVQGELYQAERFARDGTS